MTNPADAENRRLATLHLHLGGLALALAELEDLHRRDELDTAGLADLAEARWRSGDLSAAAGAAADHLAAGGSRPIARVIAAEAAIAAGRPGEARAQVETLGGIEAEALDHLFAGMPRRAFWPSAPTAAVGPEATLFGADRPAGPPRPGASADPGARAPVPTGPGFGDAGDGFETPGFWGEDEPGLARRGQARLGRRDARSPAEPVEPAVELARAREELASADAAVAAQGLTRLGLALRQAPALAPEVLRALGPRDEVAALLLRGDACRLLGRHLEAEAAFMAAASALDEPLRPRFP